MLCTLGHFLSFFFSIRFSSSFFLFFIFCLFCLFILRLFFYFRPFPLRFLLIQNYDFIIENSYFIIKYSKGLFFCENAQIKYGVHTNLSQQCSEIKEWEALETNNTSTLKPRIIPSVFSILCDPLPSLPSKAKTLPCTGGRDSPDFIVGVSIGQFFAICLGLP